MGKKQVIFRLNEDIYCQFKTCLALKGLGVQEVMEEAVKKIVQSSPPSPNIQRTIKQLLEKEIDKIKISIREASLRSLIIMPCDDFSVQVLIDEFGDIKILETPVGWVPASVNQLKAYLLSEFHCSNLIDFCNSYNFDLVCDPQEAIIPFTKAVGADGPPPSGSEFVAWLRTQKFHGLTEDNSNEEFLYEAACLGVKKFISLIYEWNPDAFKIYRDWLFRILETKEFEIGSWVINQSSDGKIEGFKPRQYPNVLEYHCLRVIRDILQREEFHGVSFKVEGLEEKVPMTDEELQDIAEHLGIDLGGKRID